MDAKQLLTLAFQVAIIGTVFGFGLKSTRDDLLYLVQPPGLYLLVSAIIGIPYVAWQRRRLLPAPAM
jgi:hypothetical protein